MKQTAELSKLSKKKITTRAIENRNRQRSCGGCDEE